jgi:hypothetical protein
MFYNIGPCSGVLILLSVTRLSAVRLTVAAPKRQTARDGVFETTVFFNLNFLML